MGGGFARRLVVRARTLGGATPGWYHRDNRFPSRRSMDAAHAPIAAAAAALLAGSGGKMLDLGCGNGVLLKKIHEAVPGCEPYGVDRVPRSIEHAQLLLPRFAANFVCADLFEPNPISAGREHFALVLLAPWRLVEADPEGAAGLRSWIEQRGDRLLIYGYGKALSDFGDLAGLAREAGLRLVTDLGGGRVGLAVCDAPASG